MLQILRKETYLFYSNERDNKGIRKGWGVPQSMTFVTDGRIRLVLATFDREKKSCIFKNSRYTRYIERTSKSCKWRKLKRWTFHLPSSKNEMFWPMKRFPKFWQSLVPEILCDWIIWIISWMNKKTLQNYYPGSNGAFHSSEKTTELSQDPVDSVLIWIMNRMWLWNSYIVKMLIYE